MAQCTAERDAAGKKAASAEEKAAEAERKRGEALQRADALVAAEGLSAKVSACAQRTCHTPWSEVVRGWSEHGPR